MVSSDLEALLEMGFEKERAEMALKKSGGLQGAIDWLGQNQDKSLDEIRAPPATSTNDEDDANAEAPALKPGEVARSLTCKECGRKLRSQAQAEFHASKTQHVEFAESTEEIAPLTEEEKKARLEELRQKLADKRAGMSEQDKIDKKKNEEIRRKSTKETQNIKEDLQKKEQLKEAAAKRKEKQDEVTAKEKIKAKIAADKEERRLKAEKEKAEREGRAPPPAPAATPMPTTSGAVVSKPASAYTEARLRLQTTNGSVQKSFPADTTLFEVAAALNADSGLEVQSFTQNYPKKVFDQVDFGATLKELGLVPSASLIVR
ncbi:ubx domain [Lasallia pustulata]|uniref:Ubx domain n=1 Tax=Lasallia pustulata TaxID=136370 RepID=A0A1W5DCZ1_9LECA|nr:ubx domain [Lasallia pustulata]